MEIVKTVKTISLSFLLLISCNYRTKSIDGKMEIFDIIGNSEIDTILLSNRVEVTDIHILKEGKKEKIIGILPLFNPEYKTTFPTIENIYLEANFVQTEKKGLRIKIRNTDFSPDTYFVDIVNINNNWVIHSIGTMETQNSDNLFICKWDIGLNINDLDDRNLNYRLEFEKIMDYENCESKK